MLKFDVVNPCDEFLLSTGSDFRIDISKVLFSNTYLRPKTDFIFMLCVEIHLVDDESCCLVKIVFYLDDCEPPVVYKENFIMSLLLI